MRHERPEPVGLGARPSTWYDVRKKVADIRHELPAGVQGPFFDDEFGDVFGSIYAFTADGFSHAELKDSVDYVRQFRGGRHRLDFVMDCRGGLHAVSGL
ncbi:MAG TPA: hypothetical protein PK959_09995 [Candidatus Competibacteraceae bacterium]|nr:hypothetical protein [Candidatus Competibacteraceae bacterium]HSA45415.1 hypothetical protein [Candidatus Competibacteraceae bacterium]